MAEAQSEIILASESPRRRELLAALGLAFAVRPAVVDEAPLPGEPPEALALRLGRAKAAMVAQDAPNSLVIAADTVVALRELVLGKPASADEALEMLRRLRGRSHRVLTGFAVRHVASGQERTALASTQVFMRGYSEAEMRAYAASGDPLDKAGGYAIQNRHFAPVASLDNCYANVVGLPLCHLHRVLARWGVEMRHPLDVCPWPLEHGGCDWAEAILKSADELPLEPQ